MRVRADYKISTHVPNPAKHPHAAPQENDSSIDLNEMIDEYYRENNLEEKSLKDRHDKNSTGAGGARTYVIKTDKEKRNFAFEAKRNKSRSNLNLTKKPDQSRDVIIVVLV